MEDGSFLTRAVEICCRNSTNLNALKLMKILRNSNVWVPCVAEPGETGIVINAFTNEYIIDNDMLSIVEGMQEN